MRWIGCLALSLAVPAPALACDCISLVATGPHFEQDLDRIAKYYPVAAEGVLEPEGANGWRLRPTREYRGPGQVFYPIEPISDCSLGPAELNELVGKPVFVLLAGASNRYEISRCVNFLGAAIDQAIRKRVIAGCTAR